MAKLKKAGLVTTRTGTDGGYQLAADPAKVTLDMVADALEVRLWSLPGTAAWGWTAGCMVASGMAGVMDHLFDDLDRRCRAHLAGVCLADLETQLESNQKGEPL